jgi:hypothetical protein
MDNNSAEFQRSGRNAGFANDMFSGIDILFINHLAVCPLREHVSTPEHGG